MYGKQMFKPRQKIDFADVLFTEIFMIRAFGCLALK